MRYLARGGTFRDAMLLQSLSSILMAAGWAGSLAKTNSPPGDEGDSMARGLTEELRRLLKQAEQEEKQQESPTLGELWPLYLSTEGQHLRSARRTTDAWKAICDVVGDDGVALKDRQALTVTAEVAEEIRTKLKATTTRFQRAPKPATINRNLIVLRRLLNWACEQRKIPHNPLRLKMEEEHNVQRTMIRSEGEFQRLLDCCDQCNRALCLLYFDGGLRRMEGINLQRHQLMRQPDGTAWVTLYETKTGQVRTVPITKRTVAALDALPDRGDYFFANPDTKLPYSKRYLYELFQKAVTKSGLQPAPGETIRWHSLRSSFVWTRRAIDHVPESTIMAFTGHRTRVAFTRYGIVDPGEMSHVVAAVENRLGRIGPKRAECGTPTEIKKTGVA